MKDGGRIWGSPAQLVDGPGEFSYPAVVAQGGQLFVTYTWKRESIAFWRFQVA